MSVEQIPATSLASITTRLLVPNDYGEVLAVRRTKASPYSEAEAGQWELPGGKADRNIQRFLAQGLDMSYLAHNAVEEVEEETGLVVEVVSSFRPYIARLKKGGPDAGKPYHGVVALGRLVGGVILPDGVEVDAIGWFPIDTIRVPQFRKDTPLALAAMSGEIERLAA